MTERRLASTGYQPIAVRLPQGLPIAVYRHPEPIDRCAAAPCCPRPTSALSPSALKQRRSRLTLRMRRFRIASAAKMRSPAAESSMLAGRAKLLFSASVKSSGSAVCYCSQRRTEAGRSDRDYTQAGAQPRAELRAGGLVSASHVTGVISGSFCKGCEVPRAQIIPA